MRKKHAEVSQYLTDLDASLDAHIKKEAAVKLRAPSLLPQAIDVLICSVGAVNKSLVPSREKYGQALASDQWSNF